MLKSVKCLQSVRRGHSLIVPYTHAPVSTFTSDLVPESQVRELNQFEGPWEFWTTSPAFHLSTPKTRGLVRVPVGESWVIERFGSYTRTMKSGSVGVVLPLLESIKSVKNTTLASLGVTIEVGGVDGYAVAYYRIADAKVSTYYTDSETNKCDSERTAARILRKVLASEMKGVEGKLSEGQKTKIGEAMLKKIQTKEQELGLVFEAIQVRGAFPLGENVPVKIRAFETPYPDLEGPGHDLAPDYWNEMMTPPYFQKMKFGSDYVPVTPIAPSMEWNVPSPPDFHHFNMQPKVAVGPDAEELKKLGAGGH